MLSSKRVGDVERERSALLRYVRSGVRSTCEALSFLQRRGVPSDRANQLVKQCERSGLLDDRACARLWAEHWERAGYAWAAIEAKLIEKKLDETAINQAAKRMDRASDDEARARRLVDEYRQGTSQPLPRARVARRLASRGFDTELIERLLNDTSSPTLSDAEQ